jgi:hypothetical protein
MLLEETMAAFTVRLTEQHPDHTTVKIEAEGFEVEGDAIIFSDSAANQLVGKPDHVVAVFMTAHVVSVIKDGAIKETPTKGIRT